MAADYSISVESVVDPAGADVSALVELAGRVMAGESLRPNTALSVLITSDEEMRRLNLAFLGIDEPTDVLAFPDEEVDDFVAEVEPEPYLGDIAIGIETALRQAAEHKHSLDAELAHLVVHGILHLCGYDHVTGAEDEARMRGREEHYLGAAGHGHPAH
jgi:probable rRNA maturation factor